MGGKYFAESSWVVVTDDSSFRRVGELQWPLRVKHFAQTSCVAMAGKSCNDGDGDSSVVRAPDSWSKGCRFESLKEWRENYFSTESIFCADSYFGIRSTPRVTEAERKRSPSLCQSAGGRLQLNTHTLYVCGFARSDMVHDCMVYTERAEMAAVLFGTSHTSAVSTPLRWIFKNAL